MPPTGSPSLPLLSTTLDTNTISSNICYKLPSRLDSLTSVGQSLDEFTIDFTFSFLGATLDLTQETSAIKFGGVTLAAALCLSCS